MVLFIACSGLMWSLLLPRAARTMQAVGDGCEMAMAAVRGTLAHPPGFPLYTAINDAIAALTAGDPYGALAAAHAVVAGAAVGVLAVVFLLMGLDVLVSGACALGFGLLPVTLWSGVHVEVFPLHHLLSALVVGAALAAAVPGAPRRRLLFLALLCGLAGAHQPIIVLWAPLVVFAAIKNLSGIHGVGGRVRAIGSALVAMIVGLLPYATLPLREQRAPELAFGTVSSFKALVSHAIRTGYGTFQFALTTPEGAHRPWDLLLSEVSRAAPLALLAIPVAVILVLRRRDHSVAAALAAASLHVVFFMQLHVLDGPISRETVLRFLPSVALSLFVLLAVVVRAILPHAPRASWLFALMALAPPLSFAPSSLATADAARDDGAAAYVDAIFDALPKGAVFFADSDLDAFCTLYQQQALGVRPDVTTIATGRLRSRWYREDLAVLAPFGASLPFDARSDVGAWMRTAVTAGRRVFSSSGMTAPAGFVTRPVGVISELFPESAAPATRDVVSRILTFCSTWPDALTTVDPRRLSSIRIRRVFLEPARVASQVASIEMPDQAAALTRALVSVEAGDVGAARQLCAEASQGTAAR